MHGAVDRVLVLNAHDLFAVSGFHQVVKFASSLLGGGDVASLQPVHVLRLLRFLMLAEHSAEAFAVLILIKLIQTLLQRKWPGQLLWLWSVQLVWALGLALWWSVLVIAVLLAQVVHVARLLDVSEVSLTSDASLSYLFDALAQRTR